MGLSEPIDKARHAVEIASEKQAENIVLIDLRAASAFTDFFVVCSARTPRQITAICEDLDQSLSKLDISLYHKEGTPDSGWVLMDFGDLVIHVFTAEQRNYYQLDELWESSPILLRVQ